MYLRDSMVCAGLSMSELSQHDLIKRCLVQMNVPFIRSKVAKTVEGEQKDPLRITSTRAHMLPAPRDQYSQGKQQVLQHTIPTFFRFEG